MCGYDAPVRFSELFRPSLKAAPSENELRISRSLVEAAASRPVSLKDALDLAPTADVQLIGRLIAHRILHANLGTGLLSHPESVVLSTDRSRIEEIEQDASNRISAELEPLNVSSRILTGTNTDLRHGRRRLARVTSMIDGIARVTRDYRALVAKVKRAMLEGRSALEECITHYCRSGNDRPRLDDRAYVAMETVIHDVWERKGEKRIHKLQREMRAEMDKIGCSDPVPSESTIRRCIAGRNPDRHNLASGGKRAFHRHRAATDPTRRTVNAIAPFSLAHIDATKFDHRSADETRQELTFSCPVLYSCIDAGTGDLLGFSLTFGPPSRFGLCALLRDIVRRHGRLPLMIVADRGSEMWSKMMIELAELYQITLVMRPASAPRFGSQIEIALREINANIAHQLVGSSLPDQKGRAADPKHKSYRTARLQFGVVMKAVKALFSDVWPDRPINELDGTPRERSAAGAAYFGHTGRKVMFDDDFLIATSVPIREKITVTADRGVRYCYREYSHPTLGDWIRANGVPQDIRMDCENSALAYAKLDGDWIRLMSNEVLEMQVKGELDRIFDRIYTRDAAYLARKLKQAVKDATLDITETANATPAADTPAACPTALSDALEPKAEKYDAHREKDEWEALADEVTSCFPEL